MFRNTCVLKMKKESKLLEHILFQTVIFNWQKGIGFISELSTTFLILAQNRVITKSYLWLHLAYRVKDHSVLNLERISLIEATRAIYNELLLDDKLEPNCLFSHWSSRPSPLSSLSLWVAPKFKFLNINFHLVTDITAMNKWVMIRNENHCVVTPLQLFKSPYAGPCPVVIDAPRALPLLTDELRPNTHAMNQRRNLILLWH